MEDAVAIRTVEMHTGGEPVRIVIDGYPPIEGRTILEKRRYVLENLDHLRRFLMLEPRGHNDMYGVIPVTPDLAEADLAVLFMHNEGYSTMCGHAVLALGRFAIDRGIVPAQSPETRVNIQCPCGLVRVHVAVADGKTGRARFESVPSFAFARDRLVATEPFGPVNVDIGYGGAFYAIVPADQFGLDVRQSPARALVDAASAVTRAVRSSVPLSHPDDDDLAFLYGTILTDGNDADATRPSANVCVFAEAQVDRSPTGSGVSARIALQHRRGQTAIGERRVFESITGATMSGMAVNQTRLGPHPAVIVEVAGEAHYTGEGRFIFEPGDPLRGGFRLR